VSFHLVPPKFYRTSLSSSLISNLSGVQHHTVKKMLETTWQTCIQDAGNNIVSPFISQNNTYAGSNGYVVRLNSSTGIIEARNPLEGYGNHEIRLAASQDNSRIIVGTNGYAVALGYTSLETLWYNNLPSSGNEVVSVACGPTDIYAGTNGYVYRLEAKTGAVLVTNSLSGYGKHETRLRISTCGKKLLVGINGYTLCLDAYTLQILWPCDMPGSGNDITSVTSGEGVGYGACRGRVYRIDMESGKILNTNDLPGVGNGEVRMALDSTTSRLYVGTNGYGICLDSNTLQLVYSTSLPSGGSNVTDVAFGNNKIAFFACNGLIYELSSSGKVSAQNDLPGRGYAETRLATNRNGNVKLVAGINGYALGFKTAN
jgi:hypothetical protein